MKYKWHTIEQKNETLETYVMIKNRKACNKARTHFLKDLEPDREDRNPSESMWDY